MASVIGKANAGELQGAALISAIGALGQTKRDLINRYFAGQSLFGVAANKVMSGFDSTDYFLGRAVGEAQIGTVTRAVAQLESAKTANQNLGNALAAAGKSAAGLSGGLVRLDRDMARVIGKANAGELQGAALISAIGALGQTKRDLINRYFAGQSLFGVAANKVMSGFDSTDYFLGRAVGEAQIGTVTRAVAQLESAKTAKQNLENLFAAKAATTTTTTTTTGTTGPTGTSGATGSAGASLIGTWKKEGPSLIGITLTNDSHSTFVVVSVEPYAPVNILSATWPGWSCTLSPPQGTHQSISYCSSLKFPPGATETATVKVNQLPSATSGLYACTLTAANLDRSSPAYYQFDCSTKIDEAPAG